MDKKNYHPFLPVLLRVLAIVLFFYWGLSHLIKPEFYLTTLMGITQFDPHDGYDMFSTNLLGIMNIAVSYAMWRAAEDPWKFRPIIDMVIMVCIGTVIIFVVSLTGRGISSREWINVGLIAVTTIILFILYPKNPNTKA
ncbi:MAG TPA: hypothetical protein VGB30_05370 [bacterium]|jgi:hypothetical protein